MDDTIKINITIFTVTVARRNSAKREKSIDCAASRVSDSIKPLISYTLILYIVLYLVPIKNDLYNFLSYKLFQVTNFSTTYRGSRLARPPETRASLTSASNMHSLFF